MMDWNWYFGALAQSAAAIVGIFGAFVVTKILSNQAAFSEKSYRAKDLLSGCQKIVDRAHALAFDWYHEKVIFAELKTLEKMLEVNSQLAAPDYFDRLDFPVSFPRSRAIDAINEHIQAWHEMRRQKEEHEQRKKEKEREERRLGIRHLEVPQPLYQPSDFQPKFPDTPTFSPIEKERESIDLIYQEARHNIRVVADFLDTIKGNPESSPQITYVLILVAVLFFGGVIYPLSFLPASPEGEFNLTVEAFFQILFTVKGALLTVVAGTFSAILAMFFVVNVRLKYDQTIRAQLEAFTNLGTYSEHFAIIEENEKAGAESRDG